jgi:nanoRNase/pAp phosphatase (c-di-AMP/oligoRNAs hydrolase)
MYPEADKLKEIVDSAKTIVVIQADNPDSDSLGSALALEQILSDLGKEVFMYCGVDMPSYLNYMKGWDRVQKDLPGKFDISIIVDASTMTLLEKLSQSGQQGWVSSKPCVVLDHHEVVEKLIPFSNLTITDWKRSSAGELIYALSKQLNWPLNKAAQEFIMYAILGDTQGLSNQLASADTYDIMAEMVRAGISRPDLEEERRASGKMPESIFKYKADLIKKTEFFLDNQLALVVVGQVEINNYSPLYNPAALIQGDMLQTKDVKVTIVLKYYDDEKVTGAIRTNPGAGIAAALADNFGGGGHKFASGFKIQKVDDFETLKNQIVDKVKELLDGQSE